ncbi:MAG TPA: CocE/NonD family hydrolase [Steroidobacteraceae bacterium]|nr:CocE/NonD family hydrolase [Steroidobacteraceae bacterium]
MSFRPPRPEKLVIRGPTGDLEAVLEEPAKHTGARFGVVCHPHPLGGGTLDNKVVHTVARVMQELGLPTLRFNFRGVGASAGKFDDGVGETDDVLAVIDWGRERWPHAAPWLAGFSFGAFVALRASERRRAQRLITIAPPVQRFQFTGLKAPDCPWLIVQGDQDEIVDCLAVLAWARSLSPPPEVAILPGAGHFFHGRLQDLKDTIWKHAGASGTTPGA